MLRNKTKIFLLCSILLIAIIGISSVSATDTNDTSVDTSADTSIDTQSTVTTDVPTTSNNNVDNYMAEDVQSTSNVDSNVKTETKESTKTVEKEDKNLKELQYNDNGWSFSLNYPHEIQSGSDMTVTYNIGLDEIVHAELQLYLMYTNSSGGQTTLKTYWNGWEGEACPNGLTETVKFTNVNPVSGAKSYYVYLNYYDDELGGLATNYNEYQFTFSDVPEVPVNVTVDSVTFAKIDDRILTNTNTNVTVTLSNNGRDCDRANVTLTVDGVSQTKTVTSLSNTPKSLSYNYTFATEGQKDVSVIVDYLNGTSFTAYTGSITVTAPTEEDRCNLTVNSVSYTKKSNKVITEANTNVTVVIGNDGTLACDEAKIILTIDGESQNKTITNLEPAATQNLVYTYYFKAPGTKTVSVVVDYLNGTTVEAYTGSVKVEVYYTTVASETLTTKATGTVTGGVYHNAIQNPSFDSSLNRKYQSDVTFTFADSYSNITTARLYAVLYDSYQEHPTYSFNLTIDGNNDGEYETVLENEHYIGLESESSSSKVFKINDNITKVYTDYVLFYDITNYVNSNTINVELNSSYGAIKCIGLIVPYNQLNSGKTVDYWINLGTVWTATETSTTFATKNHQADNINLTQSIASSANPSTTFNNNQLTYTQSPSGYFGIESWNVTDIYSSSSNMQLKNTVTGPSLKTMAATLELTTYLPTNITVDSVTFTKTQDTVLAYNDTNVTVIISNKGPEYPEATVTLTIGDESQTKTVTNIGSTPQNVVFEEYFTAKGEKDVNVVIDYLNGTTVNAYTGTVNVVASGYIGKSFSNGTNMTVRPTYDGNNTLNVFGHFFSYKSNSPATFTFDAGANGLVDQDKVVDVLYYQPWGTWSGQNAHVDLNLNGNNVSILSSYSDQKGFGSWDFPYGLNVYNITGVLNYNDVNTFTVTPVRDSGTAYIYGGYIVAIYANNTNRTVISIAEDQDALSAGTSSSYGGTAATAITYANHNGIDLDEVSSAYVVVAANNAAGSDNNRVIVNTQDYGNLGTYYNYDSQVAIGTYDITDNLAENNVVSVNCISDTSVYVLSSILVVTYEAPAPEAADITVDSVTFTMTQDTVLAYNDTNVTVTISNDGAECAEANVTLTVGDESQTKTVTNIGSTPQNVVFEEYFTSSGDKDVTVVIDYLNGTTVTAYTGSVNVFASGYMGKSFSNGTNMTVRPTYDGNNTLNVFGHFFSYKSNSPATFTFDAGANGLVDQDKVVDVLYYQPWGTWNGLNASVTLTINDNNVPILAQYEDQKGFGSYNYPYGLNVYNITGVLNYNDVNTFTVTPVRDSGTAYIYGGYIVAIYANNTNRTVISIAEDEDALSAGSSSSYGGTAATAITYANHNGIDLDEVSSAYVVVAANNAASSDNNRVIINSQDYGNLGTYYNSSSQVAIGTYDIIDNLAEDNVVSVNCIQDSSVYVLSSILVVTYEKPTNVVVNAVDVTASKGDLLVETDNTITVSLSNDGKATSGTLNVVVDGESTNVPLEDFAGETTIDVTYNPSSTGEKSVKVDFVSEDTTQTLYEGVLNAFYNGYRGKSFTNGENFTTKRVYTGQNTLILEQFDYYNWNVTSKAVYDASNLESDKIVDVLYYQGYNWDKYLNFTLMVNGVESPIIANYSDAKGFGTYNYPSGVVVFNITAQFLAGQSNEIVPTALENNSNILYGGILVIIYANNIDMTTIMINEGSDLLNPESSGLTTNDYTIAYANYENVESGEAVLYTISAAADKANGSKIIFNGEEYGCLAENYDSISKLSIVESKITNLNEGDNLVELASVNDNLFTMGTILLVSNPIEPTLKIDTIEFSLGETTSIQAGIYYGDVLASSINKGKVVFKVNGKTLKDTNGKVIYAKVVNGLAIIENFTVPESWDNNTVIEATYSGSSQLESIKSEKVNLTISKGNVQLSVADVTASNNQTITLSANVTVNGQNVDTGKVIFKINGKTVKDENGKVIYAEVVDGVANVNYTLSNLKANEYTITCVFTSTTYERAEQNAKLTVVKT
ncbi:DUF3344 domain-containing protein [Methanosphaera sp. BMS]|uniref:DUF3344 domain-containing protein n=1 Tax=Methanosphaera sp. BMS TaxID=1789762 RepID=UPI000DC1E14A|nr:DUF3344 domain-containing protein [Methanosphaera sp. BMS]AWX31601.1 hypothetical protein AW729_00225 [Methanosphaera sp. BMS]